MSHLWCWNGDVGEWGLGGASSTSAARVRAEQTRETLFWTLKSSGTKLKWVFWAQTSEIQPISLSSARFASTISIPFQQGETTFSHFNLVPELFRVQKSVCRVCFTRNSAAEVQETPPTPHSRTTPFQFLKWAEMCILHTKLQKCTLKNRKCLSQISTTR